MANKTSGFRVATITNNSQSNTFSRENVYNVHFYNETGFEIIINSPEIGSFKLGAGKDLPISGHPDYPLPKLTFTVGFSPIHIETDSIKIVYTQSYVNCK